MQCYPVMQRLKEWLTLGAEHDLTMCRTGPLAEGWSSVPAQTRTVVLLLSSSTSSGMCLLLSFPAGTQELSLFFLCTIFSPSSKKLFPSVSSPSPSGTDRAHRRLGIVLCCHRFLVTSWKEQGSQSQTGTEAKPHCQVNFIYKHTNS